jgi:mannose-1-phosphate guanylyltransferase
MNRTWALVLAAGEGSRLRTLTTTHTGVAVPKQFCSLRGGPSLLQEALHRAEAIAPRSQICTIVAAQHRRWWEGALASLPRQNVIVQPENRGTAAGLLLPMLLIEARDPQALIVVLPSDHYVRDEATLARSLRQAAARLRVEEREILLLGMSPDEADPELGYVVPGASDGRGGFHVSQFVEKPPLTLARTLIDRGGLWNSFILAGRASAFIDPFARRYREIVCDMRNAVRSVHPHAALAVNDLYARLPELDFSRHVLEGEVQSLRLLPTPACGWSDLGTPKRVGEALRRLTREDRTSRPTLGPAAYLNLAAQHARLQMAI